MSDTPITKENANEYTMTLKDVMESLGFKTDRMLRKAIKEDKLKAKLIARRYRFKPADVAAYIKGLPDKA